MSSDDNRLRFHMGCGERLNSRHRIIRCVSGALLRTSVKSGEVGAKHDQRKRKEDRDQS